MATLFRGMDRAALDAAYNNREAVADYAAYMDRWRRRSEEIRAAANPRHLDLAYGTAPRTRLDFFPAPPGRRDAPTLMFIHGGYWQNNAKEGFAFVADGLLPHGVNVAVPGYTLGPVARMDRIVAEIRDAVRWLAAHLPELGGDPDRLVVAGWSAGGHLTAMAMGEPAVAGGVSISGIFDLEPIRLNYLNEKLGMDEVEAARNSPIRQLPARAGRLCIAVGGAELPELQRQSAEYAAAWRAAGLPGEFMSLPGKDHFFVLEELSRPDGALAAVVRDLAGAA
jgi:arylformamidase